MEVVWLTFRSIIRLKSGSKRIYQIQWEIRGSNTCIRGRIGLIKSGTGLVLGTIDLVDSKRLSLKEYQQAEQFHCIEDCQKSRYDRIHAWVLAKPIRFATPVPYDHPRGAVIWVNLDNDEQ